MKFLGLLIQNVFRNRRRTILTVASIAASLFLVATLLTLLTELENPPETPDSAVRLVTRHRVSLANILPISHKNKIANVDGVEAVIGSMWFGGVYKDPKNFFAQFAVDTDQFFAVHSDIMMPQGQKDAFLGDRTGAIVGENLASRFDWNLGDKIHLRGALFPVDAELNVDGIYTGGSDEANSLYFHWDYFNESLVQAEAEFDDFTGTFTIRADAPTSVPRIAEDVDALFQNSSAPTKTESEKAFFLGFINMLGNVRLLVSGISVVVIFTIVLVAANTMAMSIRERIREIGILNALGFRRSQILGLLIAEALLLALSGALLGSLGAKIIFARVPLSTITSGILSRFLVTPETLATCLAIGAFVGIASAGIPAWQAARRSVVDALRHV